MLCETYNSISTRSALFMVVPDFIPMLQINIVIFPINSISDYPKLFKSSKRLAFPFCLSLH